MSTRKTASRLKPLAEAHETYPGIFCRCPDEEAMHRERCPVYQETIRRWIAQQNERRGLVAR